MNATAPDQPGFEDLYDPATLQAIDRRGPEPANSPDAGLPGSGGQRLASRVVSGAMAAGLMRGVADVFDEDTEDDAVIDIFEEQSRRLEPVVVHLVPGNPSASIALVRRWLFT